MGKSPHYLGLSICEKGTVTLFVVRLPSLRTTVACYCRVAATMQKMMGLPSREDGSAWRYPLSKMQIPKGYGLHCFPGEVGWKERFSGMRLACRSEHPVRGLHPWGKAKAGQMSEKPDSSCITCIHPGQLLFTVRIK